MKAGWETQEESERIQHCYCYYVRKKESRQNCTRAAGPFSSFFSPQQVAKELLLLLLLSHPPSNPDPSMGFCRISIPNLMGEQKGLLEGFRNMWETQLLHGRTLLCYNPGHFTARAGGA